MCRFRIGALPGYVGENTDGPNANPYIACFYRALRLYGIHCVCELQINDAWLRANAQRFDAIHLHWPEYLWGRAGRSALQRLHRAAGLWRYLRVAKRLGIERIFTMHNMEPHDGCDWIDRIGFRIVAANAEMLICHSQEAAELLQRRDHPAGRVVVMRHGNYEGAYPQGRGRAQTIRDLGLKPDLPLLCCLGTLRNYKGIDVACEAAQRLRGEVQLLIAGEPYPDFDLSELQARVRDLTGVLLIDRRLSEEEFADVVEASEAVLLPYRKITGSGILLAAWTLGRGVITSNLPYFREMLAPEAGAGTWFRCGDASAMAEAIRSYLQIPPDDRTRAAQDAAMRYSWDVCVKPVAEVLNSWLREKNGKRTRGVADHLRVV